MDGSQYSDMYEAVEKLFSQKSVGEEDLKSLQETIFTNIIPQFNEAIVLTDLLGVSRSSLFNSINNGFIEKIKSEIEVKTESLDEKRQQKLWLKLMKSGHKYIHHPVMQPLIMHVLGKMTSVKEAHLSEILRSKELYDKTPMNVLRHVWLDNSQKLNEEIDSIVDIYVSDVIKQYNSQCEDAILQLVSQRGKVYSSTSMDVTPYVMINSKKRKLNPQLTKIVQMIGESKVLCENIMQILQDRFVDGQLKKEQSMSLNPISTLRLDIVTSLQEKHLSRLFDSDDLHVLIMHLNACSRDMIIDNKHAIDICKQLKERHHLSKDMEFICTDPFVLYTTALTIISSTVDATMKQKKLPRQVGKLTFLCSLLSYGLSDFDNDSGIDRMHSSLKSPSFSAKKRPSFSFDNDSNSTWTKDEIVETMMLNVLPNIQNTIVSVKREQICNQKSKVNASVLKRSISDSVVIPTKHAAVPIQYLGNPLGRLMIQYHCLYTLHRKEYFLLKLLLTAISTSRRSDHRPTVEWRPELLQAIVFGICSLQNSNEKVMIDLLTFLRPAIPMSSVFFQLLYLVTVGALRDTAEIEKLSNNFMKHPNIDADSIVIGTGRSLREIVDIIVKGYTKESQVPFMTPRFSMATPSHMMMTPNVMRTPYYSQTSYDGPRYAMTPQSFYQEPSVSGSMFPPRPGTRGKAPF